MKSKRLMCTVLAACAFVFTSCGVGPAVKELKKINNGTARYWIEFIKEYGINAMDNDGEMLLTVAAESNNLSLVKACVKSGADVNLFKKGGYPAVEYAALNDNVDMVEFLIDKGAVILGSDYNLIADIPYRAENPISERMYGLLFKNIPKSCLDGSRFDFLNREYPANWLCGDSQFQNIGIVAGFLADMNYRAVPEDVYYLRDVLIESKTNIEGVDYNNYIRFYEKYRELTDQDEFLSYFYVSNDGLYEIYKDILMDSGNPVKGADLLNYMILEYFDDAFDRIREITGIYEDKRWSLLDTTITADIYNRYLSNALYGLYTSDEYDYEDGRQYYLEILRSGCVPEAVRLVRSLTLKGAYLDKDGDTEWNYACKAYLTHYINCYPNN